MCYIGLTTEWVPSAPRREPYFSGKQAHINPRRGVLRHAEAVAGKMRHKSKKGASGVGRRAKKTSAGVVRRSSQASRGVRRGAPVAKALSRRKPEQGAIPGMTAKKTTQRQGFKTNEFIVYPAHGVGQIVAIEE